MAGERLDRVVPALLPQLSRRRARDILLHGGVWSGTRRIRSQSLPVTTGMELIVLYPPDFRYPTVTLDDSHVVWEDASLIAFAKEAGWYVQPNPWDVFGNLEHAAGEFLKRRDGRVPQLHLMHRLDKETSGIILLTKNPAVNGKLQKLWSSGDVQKTYLALVAGSPPDTWHCDEPLGPGPGARYRVDPNRGKTALTDFTTLAHGADASEIQAEPRTGRTHQIRIHAAHTGHPLLGDSRYDGPEAVAGQSVARTMLHALRLSFPHPQTGKTIVLEAPPPEDYRRLREALLG